MNSQQGPAGKSRDLEEANRLFEAVWKRVMKGSEHCPIVLDASYEEQKSQEKASSQPMGEEMTGELAQMGSSTDLPMPLCSTIVGRQEEQSGLEDVEDGFPSRKAVPFFGSGSAAFEELLHDCIRRELHCRQVYKVLGQRAGGPAAKHFAALAAENLRAAKRLGAACFLITGAQPKAAPTGRIAISSYLGTLRDHFIEEQQSSALYLAAAAESQDPWLVRLFSELADEKLENAHRIYLIVEMA